MNKVTLTILLFVCLMLACGIVATAPSAIPPADSHKISQGLCPLGYTEYPIYKNQLDFYEIDGRINGNESIRLMLEPTQSASLFNKIYIRLLGIDYITTSRAFDYHDTSDTLYIATIDSIIIGDAKINSKDVYVLNFDAFPFLEDIYVEGIIGRDFLLRYHAIIDYSSEILYLKTNL